MNEDTLSHLFSDLTGLMLLSISIWDILGSGNKARYLAILRPTMLLLAVLSKVKIFTQVSVNVFSKR